MRWLGLSLLVVALGAGRVSAAGLEPVLQPELAPTEDAGPPSPAPGALLGLRDGRGLFTHDEHRFGQRWNLPVGVVLRTLMDLVAIPSGVVAWDVKDWTLFAGVIAVTVGLSLPFNPSADVAIQRGLQEALGGADHFRVWTTYGDMFIWATIYGAFAATALYGLIEDAPAYVEAPFLALEAFLVVQVFHWGIKMLAGRDGPERNVVPGELTSDGTYHGPAGFVSPYGSGTPSGHAASMYALFSVVMHYVDTPLAWIGLNLVGVLACITIIADNYHFASEVILGAVMGFCVGRWVTEHRSSRYRNDEGGLPRRVWNAVKDRVTLTPTLLPGGGYGGALVVRLDG
jgi:membrane-associated phospholipid phosphatase